MFNSTFISWFLVVVCTYVQICLVTVKHLLNKTKCHYISEERFIYNLDYVDLSLHVVRGLVCMYVSCACVACALSQSSSSEDDLKRLSHLFIELNVVFALMRTKVIRSKSSGIFSRT